MTLVGPPPKSRNPLDPMITDFRNARRSTVPFPPGATSLDPLRARRMLKDPLRLLLDGYREFGPVFTLRLLTSNVIVLLGPEANHHLLVSNAANFSWRDGSMGNLVPLLGDGLLTIDGEFHRSSRRIMLPAFHRERIIGAYGVIAEEIAAAHEQWRADQPIDLYHWTRRLALRIAMRALFGLDPDAPEVRGAELADLFEKALSFFSLEMPAQMLRGPRTPYARMQAARRRLDDAIFGEIARRRRSGERGEDLMSLLLDASTEDGVRLDDQHVRDEVMTLLFAGHDTTTSTVSFLFYELARNPGWGERLRAELLEALGGRAPGAEDLMGERLPLLEQVIDETLRLYPAAWVGPRRSIAPFEVCGVRMPGGAPVLYSSWASHHLPGVWEQPFRFRPERFDAAGRAALAKGQYVPFGGGSRQCIGMRFGQLEIRAIVSAIVARFDLELAPGYQLRVRQAPTIGPEGGLPMLTREPGRGGLVGAGEPAGARG
jgi:cytochrome P450